MSLIQYHSFESKLAYHTAPSLLGIKCASLVSIDENEFNIIEQINQFNIKAEKKNLKIRSLCRCKNRTLILLYNEKLLTKRLKEKESRDILLNYGYDIDFKLENDLVHLSDSIAKNNDFPHEIGIFLGYPIEDVAGFIEHKGDNFKLCGCWKVYGDIEKAKRMFKSFDNCRAFLCNKLNQGNDIYQALKIS